MEASQIYTETIFSLESGVRRIIHQGGAYSGKTVNILSALATLCAREPGGVTTVTGMSFPHLKGGALRDFEDYVYPDFKGAIKQYHRTDHTFTFKSGPVMEFKVFETEMAARGSKRKRLFINEANKFDYMVFFQLDGRSEQTIIDYNPTIRFWSHEKLEPEPNTIKFISDHRHNPFISDQKHLEIENIGEWRRDKDGLLILGEDGKPIRKTGDEGLWKVYARGLTGNVTGVIFPNWEMIDDDDFPRNEDWVYSCDFGYTNDPTAIVKQVLVGNTLFVKELAYETSLPPINCVQILRANGFDAKRSPLYCEHDNDMIFQLRKHGATYATQARKGQGSVNAGIELLKTFDVKYPASSRNIHRERGMYIWEEDKKTGEITNIPVDRNNHLMDAIRYGAYTRYLKTVGRGR